MNDDTITINGTEYIRKDAVVQVQEIEGTPVGKYCIVRCRDAGVWAGLVQRAEGREATVVTARRLWEWTATNGHTLSAVANYGIKAGKIPAAVPVVYLTETCELIPCSNGARAIIEDWKAHNE